MQLIRLDDLGGSRIAEFGSSAAHAAHLAAGAGEAQVRGLELHGGSPAAVPRAHSGSQP